MTFEEFQTTRTFCPDLSKVDGIDDLFDRPTPGFLYDGDAYIIITHDGEQSPFMLDLQGDMHGSGNLDELERKLHEFFAIEGGYNSSEALRAELAARYVEQIGYDPFADEPTLSNSEVMLTLVEHAEIAAAAANGDVQ